MTQTSTQAAAIALSLVMALATVAGMNGIASARYAAAESLAMAASGQTHVAQQVVVVVGRRA